MKTATAMDKRSHRSGDHSGSIQRFHLDCGKPLEALLRDRCEKRDCREPAVLRRTPASHQKPRLPFQAGPGHPGESSGNRLPFQVASLTCLSPRFVILLFGNFISNQLQIEGRVVLTHLISGIAEKNKSPAWQYEARGRRTC
jgi:hypothetical protein